MPRRRPFIFFFFKQKTAYEIVSGDWSSDVCSSDLPQACYNALFQAASATLRDVAANPKRLGARVGILMVLHTWGQNLHHHPHVHAVATGGGPSCNEKSDIDGSPEWRSCR